MIGWLIKHLFSTWYNVLLTVLSLGFIFVVLRAVLVWAVRDARWEVVTINFRVFFIGRYPIAQAWRVLASLGIVVVLAVLSWIVWRRKENGAKRWLLIGWLLSFPLIGILLNGFTMENPVLPQVSAELWSGLLLTLVLAIVGIVASFPLGVLLALGRRSKLPVVKVISTVYIETIRGVPLISVLFMSQLILPLFLPPQIRLGTVLRALTGITLFSAAYTAENVRGGLAAIPRGQFEASRALGLNKVLETILIVLPQALRTVIPAIVGQFISLFKDTTLVVIVGLLEVLGIAKAVTGQRQFIGLHQEVYCFVALLFFICCYTMAYASRRLERALGVGER
ncbi:MAG TPA: amino acid ABC transporter permease [Spirochaetia bacterium]|nr:amino acid ABC transporter permease [Spirochaetia bacterium]